MSESRFPLAVALAILGSPSTLAADVSFEHDVMAVLSRAGCNSGACHGNLNGKGGLKLSLRGEDARADFVALTRDLQARRTDPHRPEASLILLKATGRVPHEGGTRFTIASPEYAVLRTWIASGCRPDPPGRPSLIRLDVTPRHAILVEPADRFTLKATAHFADGSQRDVTALSAFEFTATGVARMLPSGEVVREFPGETVLLVRYLNQVVAVRVVFLPARAEPNLNTFTPFNPIDRHVLTQLRERRLMPADIASDAVFLRRVYLDLLGLLPTAVEARAFLDDPSPRKREALVEALLDRPEFAEFWAQKWSDLLRNEEKALDRKGVAVFYRWIAAQFAADRPLNVFAAEILAARGSTYEHPPANFWRAIRDPLQRSESVAQVFLGIRIGCARCHNHPFDRWTIEDYYGFSAFFTRIDYRVLENKRRDDLDKHEFVGEQIVFQKREGEMVNPRTQAPIAPRFLGDRTPALAPDADRLQLLANWVAAADNAYFAPAQVNRIWLHLMGRGLVDPNDDFRATNPPANPELLDWLTAAFKANGFRLKPLVRTIVLSRTYQLASLSANVETMGDELHYSHALITPLKAEQLLDAISQVTEVPVPFAGYPLGLRANQIPAPPQTGRRFTTGEAERFLKVFGKPERLLTCECERNDDPGLLQAFQMITGDVLNGQLRAPGNRIGRLLAAGTRDADMLEEFYLAALSRRPNPDEAKRLLAYVAAANDRRAAWEDVVWALLNSKEFLLRQ